MLKKIFVLCLTAILLFGTACSPTRIPSGSITSDDIGSIIEQYRQEIPLRMQQENVPGLAIAVVDDQNILWEEGFGYTDWDNRIPVAPNTLFSIQSMSKSFTATAAMFAAQDGLVDLDAPITTYLPDFHVNSIFEEHPEQKITLRMLLSHTAGFAFEAPYGSNYDHPAYSFEKHIASISDTWLMFPVGTRYGYSNLGIDLAGYILQVRSGMPFVQYVQQTVLDPLGMRDSTLDVNRLRATPARAIGHSAAMPFRPPVDFLLIPSGGVWTTAEDMARYLQFHINKGALDGTRLLSEDLAETMYTPPNIPAHYYAQGIIVTSEHGTRRFEHGGGGWGFNSDMIWYPELKLGAVVLCNAELSSDLVYQLNKEILDSIIANAPEVYAQRARSAVLVEPAYLPDKEASPLSDNALQDLIESKGLPADEAAQQQSSALAGKYMLVGSDETVEVSDHEGELVYSYFGNINPLTQVEPRLYFSPYGDALDFRGPTPRYGNIRLVKVSTGALALNIALFAICGLVFLSALFFWPARPAPWNSAQGRTGRRCHRSPSAQPQAGLDKSPGRAGFTL
ncbi:MAG TPA: serine hydrolase domain-containing protein [Anaerolineales bacterium]|nr:serine hydrolase domain-containing protein [Anaerolineales bacterium]